MNPWKPVADFEAALAKYTGAPHVVCVNSCTAALLLALEWWCVPLGTKVEVPKRTYCSVPMSVVRAGLTPVFVDKAWRGAYQLAPSPVWDCARRFTSGMYVPGQFQCISFAAAKILGMEQGGAILHDDKEADAWLRRMRFDGRTAGVEPADDPIQEVGYHCPMLPSVAAQGLLRLYHMPFRVPDMGAHDYADVSQFPVFRKFL